MAAEEFKRKLTAILSADVQGYSRMMGEDEDSTIRTLTAYRELMSTLIEKHRGRVVDSPGDNLLAEFGSVVDAVRCAVEIQEEFKVRNDELPENQRMVFRIGINLGDVVAEGERIYGDGVNIAARVEGLADGGGICISGTVYDSIKNKLSLSYEPMGEHTVKNIKEPIRVYRMRIGPEATVPAMGDDKQRLRMWKKTALVAVAVLVLLAGGLAIWNFYWRTPEVEPASKEKMAFPLPDKPSIAVMPFLNMSADSKQVFFTDGLTEGIITALAKVPQLFVVGRDSTFSYKGKAVKAKQVSEELGVQYVLEGSVQKAGDKVRITAQLIDALTGRHLWAERYDRKLEDIFALQDEITIKVISALQVKLTEGEVARVGAEGTRNLEAYLKIVQARDSFFKVTKEGVARTRRLAEEAITLDPEYAAAYGWVGTTHWMEVLLGASKSPKKSMELAFKFLEKTKAMNDSLPIPQLGYLYFMTKQYAKGIAECERGVALDPNSGKAHIWLALVLDHSGRHEEAVRQAEQGLRLDPLGPAWYLRVLGMAYSWVGRYEKAIAAFNKSLQRAPNDLFTHLNLAVTYAWAGRLDDAHAQVDEVLRINPKYCLEKAARRTLYKNQADRDRYLEGLRKAGLPETPPLPLPNKPSIAVLPFVNMSGDPEQEYFSDGISEEIITALSKIPKLFVIARNSSFTYKGKPVKVQQVGRELGVKYVLEGSVRKAENRVRVTAQLVDASSGHHIWADRYDRELKDIFALQDDITMKVITALQVELTEGERAGLWAKSTNNLEAYLKFLEGVNYTYEDKYLSEARPLFEKAISLDPQFSSAYGRLAYTYLMDVWWGPSESRSESFKKGVESAKKCVAIDDSEAFGHAMLGQFYLMSRRYDQALEEGNKALALSPNDSWIALWQGMTLRCVGRYDEAVSILQRAVRLDPLNIKWPLFHLGTAYLLMRRYEDAIETYKKALNLDPNIFNAYLGLAVAYSTLDRMDEARAAASDLLKLRPKFSVMNFTSALPYKNEADKELFVSGLRKAGLK